MDIETLALIAEVVGGFAVVVSLLYVAFQVRQNTSALKVSTLQDLVANQNAAHDIIANNPDLADLMVKADRDYENLSEAERKRFTSTCFSLFNVLQTAYSNNQAKLMDAELWEAWMRGYGVLLKASPGIVKEWQSIRETYTPPLM